MQFLLNGGGRFLLNKRLLIFSIEDIGQFTYPERPASRDNWLCSTSLVYWCPPKSQVFLLEIFFTLHRVPKARKRKWLKDCPLASTRRPLPAKCKLAVFS